MKFTSHVMMSLLFSCCAFPVTMSAQAVGEQTLYPRRMVVEKATGTWCRFCPVGIVAMEQMEEKYPDDFIGIDIHIRDEMTCRAYNNLDIALGSVPDAQVNRKEKNVYPSFWTIENYYNRYTAPINAKVETTIVKKDETSYVLESDVTLGYSTTTAKYNLAYVILEDKVGPYVQINGFTGGTRDVGGWEKKGGKVSTMYDNVARTILPDLRGTHNSISMIMTRDVPKKKSFRVEPAQYVTNLEHAKVVTLLLDGQTGEIVNADLDAFAKVMAVSTPLMQEDTHAQESVYDLYGRKMSQPQKGLNIINGKKVMR